MCQRAAGPEEPETEIGTVITHLQALDETKSRWCISRQSCNLSQIALINGQVIWLLLVQQHDNLSWCITWHQGNDWNVLVATMRNQLLPKWIDNWCVFTNNFIIHTFKLMWQFFNWLAGWFAIFQFKKRKKKGPFHYHHSQMNGKPTLDSDHRLLNWISSHHSRLCGIVN